MVFVCNMGWCSRDSITDIYSIDIVVIYIIHYLYHHLKLLLAGEVLGMDVSCSWLSGVCMYHTINQITQEMEASLDDII